MALGGHSRRRPQRPGHVAALTLLLLGFAEGWVSKGSWSARAPTAHRMSRRCAKRVVVQSTPSKSWKRGNALGYASGDVYAKHGLESILSTPLLTKSEEFELGNKVQKLMMIESVRKGCRENRTDASDDAVASLLGYQDPIDIFRAEVAGRDAREHMILANMRLVVSTARRAQARLPRATQLAVDRDGGSQALEDLVAEGTLGLTTAVDRYDPGRGFRFSTYAVWWVRQSIQKASRKRQIVAVPRHVQDLNRACANATKELSDMLGRSPSIAEVAAYVETTPKKVSNAIRSGAETFSMDVPLGRSKTSKGSGAGDSGDAASLQDLLESPEPQPMTAAAFHELRDAIDVAMRRSLEITERDVLRLRLGLDDGNSRTRPQVATIVGLDTRRVRAIEQCALTKLRKGPSRLRDYLPRDGGRAGPPPEV